MKLTVYGHPETQGSKRHVGRGIIIDANKKLKPWRQEIVGAAMQKWKGLPLLCPIELSLCFYFTRPKSHYRTGKKAHLLKDSAPVQHIKRPDVMKLGRAVEDALTGVCWKDDSQIWDSHYTKRYTDGKERVEIEFNYYITLR